MSEQHFERGCESAKDGDVKNAIIEFEKALELDSTHPGTYVHLSRCYKEVKNFTKLLEILVEKRHKCPDFQDFSDSERCLVEEMFQDNWEEVVRFFTEAFEAHPKNSWNLYFRSYGYQKLKDHERAIRDVSEAIKMNPNRWEYYHDRADYHHDINEYEKALQDYSRTFSRIPSSYRAHCYHHRGMTYSKMGKYQQAVEDYTRAISLDPCESLFYCSRGIVYKRMEDYQKALQELNKAIEMNSSDDGFYDWRGTVYSDLSEFEKATQDYNKAIEMNPKEAIYYCKRGNVIDELGRVKEAIEDYSKAILLDPNNSLYFWNRGWMYKVRKKEFDSAIKDFTKVIELDGQFEVRIERGECFLQQGRFEDAILDFTEGWKLGLGDDECKRKRDEAVQKLKQKIMRMK